jgi:hypothetical protein
MVEVVQLYPHSKLAIPNLPEYDKQYLPQFDGVKVGNGRCTVFWGKNRVRAVLVFCCR